MMQTFHFLWPPFLFAFLHRQLRRTAQTQIQATIQNLPYVDPNRPPSNPLRSYPGRARRMNREPAAQSSLAATSRNSPFRLGIVSSTTRKVVLLLDLRNLRHRHQQPSRHLIRDPGSRRRRTSLRLPFVSYHIAW